MVELSQLRENVNLVGAKMTMIASVRRKGSERAEARIIVFNFDPEKPECYLLLRFYRGHEDALGELILPVVIKGNPKNPDYPFEPDYLELQIWEAVHEFATIWFK